jgi:hypothetical protein
MFVGQVDQCGFGRRLVVQAQWGRDDCFKHSASGDSQGRAQKSYAEQKCIVVLFLECIVKCKEQKATTTEMWRY